MLCLPMNNEPFIILTGKFVRLSDQEGCYHQHNFVTKCWPVTFMFVWFHHSPFTIHLSENIEIALFPMPQNPSYFQFRPFNDTGNEKRVTLFNNVPFDSVDMDTIQLLTSSASNTAKKSTDGVSCIEKENSSFHIWLPCLCDFPYTFRGTQFILLFSFQSWTTTSYSTLLSCINEQSFT